jgi:FMN reductase (NADPH)/FMN reductase [NAD(P)H]
MNESLDLIMNRKSLRSFLLKEVEMEKQSVIIEAALRAPTAGNMMLYSIINVTNQDLKNTLSETCDHQPFIAKAPFILLFLADLQRWYDYFKISKVPDLCNKLDIPFKDPEKGKLFLACCDTMVAAQNSVIAAESLGMGSCYIGDIMENYEIHKDIFDLPPFVFPLTLICFGYPTSSHKVKKQSPRFSKEFIVYENRYKRLTPKDFKNMYQPLKDRYFDHDGYFIKGANNLGQHFYLRKFVSDYAAELDRSINLMMENWK